MIRTLFAPGEIKLAIQRFVFVPVRGVTVDLRQTGPDDRINSAARVWCSARKVFTGIICSGAILIRK
jgi:hypothetical protein